MGDIPLKIVDMKILGGADLVVVMMNDGSSEVLPIDNKMVQEYVNDERRTETTD